MSETMDRLASSPADIRAKIRFVHLNQSNPALRGFTVATEGERTPL